LLSEVFFYGSDEHDRVPNKGTFAFKIAQVLLALNFVIFQITLNDAQVSKINPLLKTLR
jgi:hypothetical protein